MSKTGLAFSGGGIRSAALCSGVLRRFLHKRIVPDYLSCVSGGGYTGTAYLDWKYRNEQQDDPRWHKEFFDNMRIKAGFLCDWQNPLQGLLDAISLLILVFFLSVIFPCINWFSFAFPTAYIVDFLIGDLLRSSFTCPDAKTHNFSSSEIAENFEVSNFLNKTKTIECVPKLGPGMSSVFKEFAFAFIVFLLLFIIKNTAGPSLKPLANVLFNVTGFAFAMMFLPWFIEQYIVVTPMWLNALILVLSIFLWLGIPPLRNKASFAMIIYLYAYVVKWRVYKTDVLSIAYTEFSFDILLWISGILIWMRPLFILYQQSLLHAYNRWRLQKAFYSPESRAATSFLEIACKTAFPLCTFKSPAESLNRPLTLADLSGLVPEYICNVTVNQWRLQNSKSKPTFEPLTMSPSGVETIVNEDDGKQFENRLHPEDVELSEAMATSAAALSYHMGKYESEVEAINSLQVLLGLGFGKSVVAEDTKWRGWYFKVIAAVIQLVLALPVILLPMIPYLGGSEDWNKIAVIFFLVFFCLLMLIAVMPTGAKSPGCWQTFVRWCIVHISHVRFLREHLGVVNVGPIPPPILYLSDGGHDENLGILPLLKRRLEKIVVINAGFVNESLGIAHSLLHALSQARDKLHCSFTGMDGQDVYNDIRRMIVDIPPGNKPRSYRFKVQYFNFSDEGVEERVGEGEILYLLPRHPQIGLSEQHRKWEDVTDDVEIDIEADVWGSGPAVESEEVNRLTCCCCECCHAYLLHRLSGSCCGVFPNHITANQFFTPAMFSAYHREGYHACMEARAAEFLEESGNEKVKKHNPAFSR